MAHHYASTSEIRSKFSAAMSAMYQTEVPLYGKLLEIVRSTNAEVLAKNPTLEDKLGSLDRITQERHGAIRLGTPAELRTMARVFAVMGMQAVGYYDLSIAGLPVHSTAFRPVCKDELAKNPFRVFTSVLRPELLNPATQLEVEALLAKRQIFSDGLLKLLNQYERDGGFTEEDTETFIGEALKTFRWHPSACVSLAVYEKLLKINSLLADIVCFRGPHINHLTPRVLDIYAVHEEMRRLQIEVIPEVQGPPAECPILLKQTSFKALNETIHFPDESGGLQQGKHRARFGEIELRDCAIKPKARAIYDELIARVSSQAKQLGTASKNPAYFEQYTQLLNQIFREGFPAWNLEALRKGNLGYFHYKVKSENSRTAPVIKPLASPSSEHAQMEGLIEAGVVAATPITYEDFLPVSAAGIFKSNLDEKSGTIEATASNQTVFEESLGAEVIDPFALYEKEEGDSIRAVLEALQ